MSNKKVFVVVPLEGSPFIAIDKDPNEYNDINEIVGGSIEGISNELKIIVHPMFYKECPRWRAVSDILKDRRKIEVYVNENGMYETTPNMGMLIREWEGTVHHMFGNIAIITKEKNIPDNLPRYKFAEYE